MTSGLSQLLCFVLINYQIQLDRFESRVISSVTDANAP
jgi:hypothetical protein